MTVAGAGERGQTPGLGKEAIPTREYYVTQDALRRAALAQGRLKTLRADRPSPSLAEKASLGRDENQLHHYRRNLQTDRLDSPHGIVSAFKVGRGS